MLARHKPHLTMEGKLFLLFTLAVGVASLNTAVNLLYMIFSMLLAVFIIGWIIPRVLVEGLELKRSLPGSIFAQEEFQGEITLYNKKRFFSTTSLLVEEQFPSPYFSFPQAYALQIPAKGKITLRYRASIAKRGVYQLNGFRVLCSFPFGLFNQQKEYSYPATLWVYPKLGKILAPISFNNGQGPLAMVAWGTGGEEFHALREFRPGDNPKWIHWKSSARAGKWMTKEFEREHPERVSLLLYNYILSTEEVLEKSISLCATLARYLLDAGYPLQFSTFNPNPVSLSLAPNSQEDFQLLLRTLTLLKPSPRPVDIKSLIKSDTETILILPGKDSTDKGWEENVGRLQIIDVTQPEFDVMYSD